MIKKTRLLVVINTFNDLDAIRTTLPTVVEDVRGISAQIIVHDCSTERCGETWTWLKRYADQNDVFLMLSSRMSLAHARNMAIRTGLELFVPDYVCVLEDDHGFRPGMTAALLDAMDSYYGRESPNGFLYGLFSGCPNCWDEFKTHKDPNGHAYPNPNEETWRVGGANSCFRAAPTAHWMNVLKGYDPDQYSLSYWQTKNLNYRNYHSGFTTLYVKSGDLVFRLKRQGQGTTQQPELRGWDPEYARVDPRARFAGRPKQ